MYNRNQTKETTPTEIVLTFTACLLVCVAYILWLDAGCELSGIATWHGKVCAEDLAPELYTEVKDRI